MPVEQASDADLVARALGGSNSAMEAIFHRYASEIRNLALRQLNAQHEADDVVQDTFIEALETLGTLRDAARLRPWLRRIAIFRIHRRFRRRRLLRALGFTPPVLDASLEALASADAGPEVRAELSLIDRRLATVAPSEHLVWTLRFVEGLTLPEIAEASGLSLATVKRRLSRARSQIGRPALESVE